MKKLSKSVSMIDSHLEAVAFQIINNKNENLAAKVPTAYRGLGSLHKLLSMPSKRFRQTVVQMAAAKKAVSKFASLKSDLQGVEAALAGSCMITADPSLSQGADQPVMSSKEMMAVIQAQGIALQHIHSRLDKLPTKETSDDESLSVLRQRVASLESFVGGVSDSLQIDRLNIAMYKKHGESSLLIEGELNQVLGKEFGGNTQLKTRLLDKFTSVVQHVDQALQTAILGQQLLKTGMFSKKSTLSIPGLIKDLPLDVLPFMQSGVATMVKAGGAVIAAASPETPQFDQNLKLLQIPLLSKGIALKIFSDPTTVKRLFEHLLYADKRYKPSKQASAQKIAERMITQHKGGINGLLMDMHSDKPIKKTHFFHRFMVKSKESSRELLYRRLFASKQTLYKEMTSRLNLFRLGDSAPKYDQTDCVCIVKRSPQSHWALLRNALQFTHSTHV